IAVIEALDGPVCIGKHVRDGQQGVAQDLRIDTESEQWPFSGNDLIDGRVTALDDACGDNIGPKTKANVIANCGDTDQGKPALQIVVTDLASPLQVLGQDNGLERVVGQFLE